MKQALLTFIILAFISQMNQVNAQADSSDYVEVPTYLIISYDDVEYIGRLISKDESEVIIMTLKNEKISIPRYQVKEIRKIERDKVSADGFYISEEAFATRYVLTTNGISLGKGESYIIWNIYGPDFQFGVGKHLSIGLMTTWMGMPLIGTIKYSGEISPNFHGGVGVLLGSALWAAPELYIALPFGVLTLGDKRNNISFSAGYGVVGYLGDRGENALFSFGGMAKIGRKASFVFDSFFLPDLGEEKVSLAVITPAFRIQSDSKRAFQIGFAGIISSEGTFPLPIPILQWFRKF